MTKTNKFFSVILLILKNATVIIPLIEGMINSIYNFNHPQDDVKDGDK